MSAGYEQAPATQMLATQCAACARPLLDAESVEAGMGPDCRRKHGFLGRDDDRDAIPCWASVATALGQADADELRARAEASAGPMRGIAHAAANVLVHRIARAQTGPDVARWTIALAQLGYRRLAQKIGARLHAVRVDHDAATDTFVVRAPFSEAFNAALRRVPGVRWDAVAKVRRVPRAARVALWAAIDEAFPNGTLVLGAVGGALTGGRAA